jgi:hypothetical protein
MSLYEEEEEEWDDELGEDSPLDRGELQAEPLAARRDDRLLERRRRAWLRRLLPALLVAVGSLAFALMRGGHERGASPIPANTAASPLADPPHVLGLRPSRPHAHPARRDGRWSRVLDPRPARPTPLPVVVAAGLASRGLAANEEEFGFER